MSASQPRISVIMRSKNSDWVIGQALAGLFSQSFSDFELLVVDSGSTDRTLDIVRQYPCRLIEIPAGSYLPGRVLNQAIEQARGELLVFQNSDVVPLSPESLARLVRAFDEPRVQAAYARQLPRPQAHQWVRHDYAKSFPEDETPAPWITLSLPFAAMRKSIWRERPFYTRAWASEDTEWGHWARSNGHAIKYVSQAPVMHSHNYTLRQLYGRRFVEGEADAFIYQAKHSLFDMLRNLAVSTALDIVDQIRARAFVELLISPVRRLVYHWAFHCGHRLGEQRRADANLDASLGQRIILARHEQ